MKREMTVYTPQKGRLETISVDLTSENTTWFDAALAHDDIAMITDWHGDLLIFGHGRDYPIRIYDVSRAEIGHSQRQAKALCHNALR